MTDQVHDWQVSDNDPRGFVDDVVTSESECGAIKTEWTGTAGSKNTVVWEPKKEGEK